jgi:hypothetical protein
MLNANWNINYYLFHKSIYECLGQELINKREIGEDEEDDEVGHYFLQLVQCDSGPHCTKTTGEVGPEGVEAATKLAPLCMWEPCQQNGGADNGRIAPPRCLLLVVKNLVILWEIKVRKMCQLNCGKSNQKVRKTYQTR